VHPRVFATSEGGLPGSMLFTFLVALAGMALLFIALMRFEISTKVTRGQISRLRRALDREAPAAPASRIAPSAPSEAR
jgi:heme exporter protein C